MRKAFPILASLLIGAGATALIASAHAGQSEQARKPVLMMAQNDAAAPRTEAGPAPERTDRAMRGPRRGQFCQNIVARKAGRLAFLETKLQLTPAQAPLFARWQQVGLDTARRHESECTARMDQPRQRRADAVERLNREEARLQRRLADIAAERPALTALYAALTPAQQQDFGRGQRGRMGERVHRMMGMMGRPGMGRRLGRGGPDGEPPMPPAQ